MMVGCSKFKQHSPVLAKVNGEVITVEDFNQQIQGLPPYYRVKFNDLENKKKLLEAMIKNRLLIQEAKKQGLHRSKELYQKLQIIKEQMLIQEVIKANLQAKAQVSDEEVERYYQLHRDSLDKLFKGRSFNEVKNDIRQIVLEEKGNQLFELWVERLKKEAKITQNIGALKSAQVNISPEK